MIISFSVVRPPSRRFSRVVGVACLLAGVGAMPGPASAGPIIETYAQTISGDTNFNFATFGTPSPIVDYFGSNGVGNPVLGISGSGLVADTHASTATAGSLTDSAALSNTYGNPSFPNTFVGSSSANAQPGKIGAEAHGTFSGLTSGVTDNGAQAMALFRETFTATSATIANGTKGTAVFEFSVHGSLATQNANPSVTTSDVELAYQAGTGPIFTLFRSQVNNSNVSPFLAAPTTLVGNPLSGFALTPGAASGSGKFDTFAFDFTFGTSFDFTLGMLAYVIPGPGGTGDVDFSSTALLSGITLHTAAGQAVTDFSIASGTGTSYDANGVRLATTNAVPEPSSIVIVCLGGVLVLGRGGRVKRQRVRDVAGRIQ